MTFKPGYKARILVGDFHLSAVANDITSHWERDVLESTVFTTAPAKSFICGQDTSTLTVAGLYDTAAHTDLASWRSNGAQALTVTPAGLALGGELWMVNALETELTTNNAVSGMAEFSLSAQTEGITDFGVSLHDLTAETADANGSSVDNAASTANGGVGHLHVTSFSGLTNVVVKVQHSTNDSVWSDLVTFSTATGVTGERSVVAGTINRYLRATWDVTGTGSTEFQVGFARR